MKNKLLLERHKDLLNVLIRCRISIDDREDPTMLDITTDMRALPGIVTVRQTRPVSDPVTTSNKRIVELNVSYIPSFVESINSSCSNIISLRFISTSIKSETFCKSFVYCFTIFVLVSIA